MVGNGVSVCPFASELSPTQRGCDWAWRWCTGRPITLSWWWVTVHSWPLRPVSPAHTLAWSCRVSKARQLSACSWVCAFSDEWKRVRSLVLCFSDDAEGEATHHRRRRCRRPNRHPCCKLSSFTLTMFALWVWGGKKVKHQMANKCVERNVKSRSVCLCSQQTLLCFTHKWNELPYTPKVPRCDILPACRTLWRDLIRFCLCLQEKTILICKQSCRFSELSKKNH